MLSLTKLLFILACANANRSATLIVGVSDARNYTADWSSLDSRPLPRWYDVAKIGIFVHWGVFTVPGIIDESFWHHWATGIPEAVNFMKKNYPPNFKYHEFGPKFTAELFNPAQWARTFKSSGAQYVILSSKHTDGFAMFPSRRSYGWNSVDVGPKRDIVKEVSAAVRKAGLKFGIHHSLYEWYNPIYLEDQNTNFKKQDYVRDKLWPDLLQLVNDYKPSVIWADGDWQASDLYWKSTHFLTWLYNQSPVKSEVVVNDRWGKGLRWKHGDFYNGDDRYSPRKRMSHKWESAFTLDKKSWGYRKTMTLDDIMKDEEILNYVVSSVSCGGNALLNIGPTKDGMIPPIFEERLRALGKWLKVNGEAIYGTSPWFKQNDGLKNAFKVWYTCIRNDYDPIFPTRLPKSSEEVARFYAIFFYWPKNDTLPLQAVSKHIYTEKNQITMLGYKGAPLRWKISNKETIIKLPSRYEVASEHAWVLKFADKK